MSSQSTTNSYLVIVLVVIPGIVDKQQSRVLVLLQPVPHTRDEPLVVLGYRALASWSVCHQKLVESFDLEQQ